MVALALQEARETWPSASGPVEAARSWMVDRYVEVDVRLAAVAKLSMLVPAALATGSQPAARGLVCAARESLELVEETCWLPQSTYQEALEGLRAIEGAYNNGK